MKNTFLMLVLAGLLGTFLAACGAGAPPGQTKKIYVECVSNMDHSTIRSDDADYWWDPSYYHINVYSSPSGTFLPRPGDSCRLYFHYVKESP
jgi:hypothetical protein